MDSGDARLILRRLVEDGWLLYPHRTDGAYRPAPRLNEATTLFPEAVERVRNAGSLDDRILELLSNGSEHTIRDVAEHVHASLGTIRPRLRVLITEGAIVATAPATSRRRAYKIAGR
jgi:ATP-dependent DNA helicase RecG